MKQDFSTYWKICIAAVYAASHFSLKMWTWSLLIYNSDGIWHLEDEQCLFLYMI